MGKYPRQGSNPSAQLLCGAMTLGKSPNPGGAEYGALHPDSVAIDPSLAKIIAAWPKLPDAVKAGIVAFAQAASGSDSLAQT